MDSLTSLSGYPENRPQPVGTSSQVSPRLQPRDKRRLRNDHLDGKGEAFKRRSDLLVANREFKVDLVRIEANNVEVSPKTSLSIASTYIFHFLRVPLFGGLSNEDEKQRSPSSPFVGGSRMRTGWVSCLGYV